VGKLKGSTIHSVIKLASPSLTGENLPVLFIPLKAPLGCLPHGVQSEAVYEVCMYTFVNASPKGRMWINHIILAVIKISA